MLIPVRTHTLQALSEDLFFPNLIHTALKIDNLALKIFMIIGSVIWDVISLPIRIVTLIPRMIFNESKTSHPFYQYLIEQRVDQRILDRDFVYVTWECTEQGTRVSRGEIFRFIQMPEAYCGQASEYILTQPVL